MDLSSQADHDLWLQLQQQLRLVPNRTVTLLKVQAHAEASQQDPPLDSWAGLLDHLAAFESGPSLLEALRKAVAHHVCCHCPESPASKGHA